MKPACKLKDCDRVCYSNKDLCRPHWRKFERWGDPYYGKVQDGSQLKFLLKVSTGEIRSWDCILWPFGAGGSKVQCDFHNSNRYYGRVIMGKKDWAAHRLSLWLSYGPPPPGKNMACHEPIVCTSRLCCNPLHLYWGDAKDNAADRKIDGTQTIRAKLNEDKVRFIREHPELTARQMSDFFNIRMQNVYAIRRGEIWKDI